MNDERGYERQMIPQLKATGAVFAFVAVALVNATNNAIHWIDLDRTHHKVVQTEERGSKNMNMVQTKEGYRGKLNLGKIDWNKTGKKINKVVIEYELEEKTDRETGEAYLQFTASGEVWNSKGTDIIEGGQMLDRIAKRFPTNPRVQELTKIWRRWHLNGMKAACEHQRELGWTYNTHAGQKCPTCGYEIGTKWLVERIPEDVIERIKQL